MGSKKHKKHHRSEKKESSREKRQEKPLKLVLKVGGNVQQTPPSEPPAEPARPQCEQLKVEPVLPVSDTASTSHEATQGHHHGQQQGFHFHEKHKKSKKKKKKKSNDRDKEKHQKRHKHHHHHHHHKEKRRREHDHSDKEPPQKRQMLEMVSCERPSRDPRSCTIKKKSTKTPLQILLYYILKNLQKKDPQQFFAWPVSDVIAPGYSAIISNPMDFSTIKRNIDQKLYRCLGEFKHDLKLMCDNAMTYNRPDTIYYKAARKMWHVGQKFFNKEQLISLSRNMPYIQGISEDELGFDLGAEMEDASQFEEMDFDLPLPSPDGKRMSKSNSYHSASDSLDDEMTPDEILMQAQKAARAAAHRLTLQKPNSKFGFLRQKEDGTTTLSVLNPPVGREVSEEIPVNLEMLIGKLSHGAGSMAGFKEDSKNLIRPVKSLNYGSFSSYAPQYDSMFSNMSKDESDLVLSTYGDELGVQYAESLLSFAKDCDYVMTMVDNLLNVITGGAHSKTLKALEERKAKEARKVEPTKNANDVDANHPVNFSELDMSFMNTSDLEGNGELDDSKCDVQQKLDETSNLLQDLAKVQHDRLSSTPPAHLSNINRASAAEHEIANKVTSRLTDLAMQATPGELVGVPSLRKALGITLNAVCSSEHEEIEMDQQSESTMGAAKDASVLLEPNNPMAESTEFLVINSVL